jgi:hypothetical protein
MVRFSSFLVWVDHPTTSDDHTTTWYVVGTVNAHKLVHLVLKAHQIATSKDMSAAPAHMSASKKCLQGSGMVPYANYYITKGIPAHGSVVWDFTWAAATMSVEVHAQGPSTPNH